MLALAASLGSMILSAHSPELKDGWMALRGGLLQDEGYWMDRGSSMAEEGSYEEAIECYDNVLAMNSSSGPAWRLKGGAFFALGRVDEALTCFNRSLQLSPLDGMGWYSKGLALSALGREEAALFCYERATVLAPRYVPAWYASGAALSSLGLFEEAVYCYDRSLAIGEPSGEIWRDRGGALAGMGRYEEALRCYENALLLNTSDWMAWHEMGYALFALQQDVEARDAFAKAERLGGVPSPMNSSDPSALPPRADLPVPREMPAGPQLQGWPEAPEASPGQGEEAPEASGDGMPGSIVEPAGLVLAEGPGNMSDLIHAFSEKPGARPE